MALRTDIVEEIVALETIAQRSLLAKHINETILRPILTAVEHEAKIILDDLGFMIVSELQHRLATAPSGYTYEVWQVDPGAERGSKYTFIGHYTASAKGGPPASGVQTSSGLPTGSLYESLWYKVNSEGYLSVTIDSPEGSEKNWVMLRDKNDKTKILSNKVFVGFDKYPDNQALPVGEYFKILERQSRPNWWLNTIKRKRRYWDNWMQGRFQKAVKRATRKWSVHKALKFSIYWESSGR